MKKNTFFRLLASLFVISGIISCTSAFAQNYQISFDAIPVTINSTPCISAFNGGIDQPHFQFYDIDTDGDLDLFIYDRDTSLNFYRNEGSVSSPSFRLITLRYANLYLKNWFYFVDINHRGKPDLFSGGDLQQIRFYHNDSSAVNPHFTLQTYPLKTATDSIMYSESVCVPTFADIDADGDLDFFTGNSIGTVTFYRNIGTPQNFAFQFVTGQFAGISIIGGGLNKPHGVNVKDNIELHGASAITFADINADSTLDLLWGDFFGRSIYFIKNTGTRQSFNWIAIDTNNPKPSPWFSAGFNMPGICDIDNDGKKDFFVGVLIGSATRDNFAYYKNTGPAANPQFSLMTKNFIPCIDVGSSSYPAFCDIDNDGKPDLFIGCGDARVSYFKNTGTAFNPAFTLAADSLPIISTSFNYAPAFGDLNGDGKKDMLLGAFDGKLRYFKNTGTLSNPVFTFTASQFDAISVAQSSAPVLVDLNGDRLLDLLIGDSGGHLAYYKNDGDSVNFHFTLVALQFQGILSGNDSAPTLADIDNDGDMDLLLGGRNGKISFYRNDGSASSPNFVLVTNNYAGINVTLYCAPALVDINNDGDKDLFVGNIKGGLYYYENRDVIGVQNISNEIPASISLGQNFPNPFNPSTTISFNIPLSGGVSEGRGGSVVTLKIYNALGKEVSVLVNSKLTPGSYEVNWDASPYPSGVYFYTLAYGDFRTSKKMILIK